MCRKGRPRLSQEYEGPAGDSDHTISWTAASSYGHPRSPTHPGGELHWRPEAGVHDDRVGQVSGRHGCLQEDAVSFPFRAQSCKPAFHYCEPTEDHEDHHTHAGKQVSWVTAEKGREIRNAGHATDTWGTSLLPDHKTALPAFRGSFPFHSLLFLFLFCPFPSLSSLGVREIKQGSSHQTTSSVLF